MLQPALHASDQLTCGDRLSTCFSVCRQHWSQITEPKPPTGHCTCTWNCPLPTCQQGPLSAPQNRPPDDVSGLLTGGPCQAASRGQGEAQQPAARGLAPTVPGPAGKWPVPCVWSQPRGLPVTAPFKLSFLLFVTPGLFRTTNKLIFLIYL